MRQYFTRDHGIEVQYEPLPRIDVPYSLYEGFNPGTTILPAGAIARADYAPLPCDILQERDVAFELRDGTTMYLDIYRPLTDDPVPVIVGWGPGGKSGIRDFLEIMPNRMNVPKSQLSGLQGWENPDPAHWVPHGYATVQVDPRGSFMSEGDMQYFGDIDAADGYEIVEWLATLGWCNGAVGLSGNSWFGMTQWSIAALRPPHLRAIAPWEGQDNLYYEEYVRGGIPMSRYPAVRAWSNGGRIEDICAMAEKYPLFNDYWAEKVPRVEDIDVPAYVVASFTSWTHTQGTFHAWDRLTTTDKWLRVHATAEWPDYYNPDNLADLRRFFDCYLKGHQTGWQNTPRIRMMTLDLGAQPIGYRNVTAFPPPERTEKTWFLDSTHEALADVPGTIEANLSYAADDTGMATFVCTVTDELDVTGYGMLKLWVQAHGSNDMDLYVRVGKLSAEGQVLSHDAVGEYFFGPFNQIRVSHRALDEQQSAPNRPRQHHLQEDLLSPGEIVPVEIALTPISMLYHPGEQIEVRVAAHRIDHAMKPGDTSPEGKARTAQMLAMDPTATPPPVISTSRNGGQHFIHTGGRFDSMLVLPILDQKAIPRAE